MKKTLVCLLAASVATTLMAQEQGINSSVIHDYKQVSVGYGYLHEVGNSDVNAHGVVAGVSYDIENVLLSVSGGYFFGDDDLGINADIDQWQIGARAGYIFRLMDNHLNVIPGVGISYSEMNVDTPFGDVDSDVTVLSPGVMVSYAFNNTFSVHAGYIYGFDVDDTDNDAHSLQVGGRVKLAENVGASVTGEFIEDYGFAGITALLSYHF